jgi:GAF domain-containing protein
MSAQNAVQGPQLVERLAELAPQVRAHRPVEQLFADISALAVELIPGADIADIMVLRDGAVLSMGATAPLAAQLDELQQRLGEGPCAQAAADSTMVRADDFGTETRWPRYAPAAVGLGVRSSLSYKIYCAGATAATMNIFGYTAHPWDDDAETVGAVLASHAAAAVAASPWGAALNSALGSRERLGQAKGIIMERYGVDDVAAFEMLRRLADQSGMGLLELAQRVIDTRTRAD